MDKTKKISVVIPTLQKNTDLLKNLIISLEKDENIEEIILIDNSTKGFELKSDKLKVIKVRENIFVNPAWNLGVKNAKCDIVALLNDDIIIPDDFCSNIAAKMKSEMGVLGYDIDFVEAIENDDKKVFEKLKKPEIGEIELRPLKYRSNNWGIAIFFYKTSYFEIPESLKIYFGDDWIFRENKKQKRQNYSISGQKIYHFGSLTSSGFSKVFKEEEKIYKKLTLNPIQRLVNVEGVFGGVRINFFGIKFTIRKKRKKTKINI